VWFSPNFYLVVGQSSRVEAGRGKALGQQDGSLSSSVGRKAWKQNNVQESFSHFYFFKSITSNGVNDAIGFCMKSETCKEC
jgi:hypothetical protein